MLRPVFLILCVISFSSLRELHGQDCSPPKIVANANSVNMFSPEQEMILGELTFQNIALESRQIQDEKLLAFVNLIGNKLIKHLPPTGLRFQFHIVDDGETNAYNIPGGHVLLTRKLVAFANNEDELAGVIAHELGHATVHHGAMDLSEIMRKVLNISSVGDRKDIVQKYNLLIENARTKRLPNRRGHENEQQLEADKIGLFALVAAGYNAEAFTTFFDRLTENKGKTGSWFSDVFGNTRPEQKRMREMIRLTNQLPNACKDNRSSSTSNAFLDWQASVVSFRESGRKESLPGLIWKRELSPKLSSDFSHLTFSGDGRYLLAQDDFAISIVERETGKLALHIPADNADDAAFTQDGNQVLFTTSDLRYERWDIKEKRPLEIRELVIRGDCFESKLSPDGNYLACIDTSTKISILETKTGKKVFEKKEFYPLSFFEVVTWLSRSRSDDKDETNFFRIEFSPDSRFILFSRSDRFRFRLSIDGLTADQSENTTLAIDMSTFKPIDIGSDIKKLSSNAFIFLDNERVLGIPSKKDVEDAGIFTFPDGKRLKRFAMWARIIKRTESPDYVVIKPLAEGGLGFFNLRSGKLSSGLRKSDATMWSNTTANEAASGRIVLNEVSENSAEKKFDSKNQKFIDIPVKTFGSLRSAEVSDNFGWLIASSKTRGALWNLTTGERLFFLRGFRGGIVGPDGTAVSEFPKFETSPHSLALIKPSEKEVNIVRELPSKGSRQFGRFVINRVSLKEDPKKKREEEKTKEKEKSLYFLDDRDFDDSALNSEIRFELTDIVTNAVVYTREFKKDVPRYSFDDFSGRLIFYWELGSEIGKDRLKSFPNLKQNTDALGDKRDDYLVEIFDAYEKKELGAFLLETGKGSFDVGNGVSEGDWLMFEDDDNRLLVYSIKTGELRHRFIGRSGILNPGLNMVAVESFPGTLNLFSLSTGDRLNGFEIDGDIEFMRFDLKGTRFFVLSSNQVAYAFDLTKIPKSAN